MEVNVDIKAEIYNYLQTQILMSISTIGEEIWPAITYFVADGDLNFYFISDPNTLHSKNIERNPNATCTIYDSHQGNAGDKIGIQCRGKIEVVSSLKKVVWMVNIWNKLIIGEQGMKLNPSELLQIGRSKVYKLVPEKIKFYNTKLFPTKKFEEIEL